MRPRRALWIILGAAWIAPGDPPRTWDFEKDAVGAIAPGFAGETGRWLVVSSDDKNHVLHQAASSPSQVFNVALVKDAKERDHTQFDDLSLVESAGPASP